MLLNEGAPEALKYAMEAFPDDQEVQDVITSAVRQVASGASLRSTPPLLCRSTQWSLAALECSTPSEVTSVCDDNIIDKEECFEKKNVFRL